MTETVMPTNPNTPNAHPSGLPECPFTDPRNVGVFTTKFVMEGEPICFVYRIGKTLPGSFCRTEPLSRRMQCSFAWRKYSELINRSVSSLIYQQVGWRVVPGAMGFGSGNGIILFLCLRKMGFISFRFADEQAPRKDNECERMWVLVTEVDGENCRYKGTLDNDPLLHNEIACGRELWLHPIHIFAKFRVLK
jgi:hypothetical protein